MKIQDEQAEPQDLMCTSERPFFSPKWKQAEKNDSENLAASGVTLTTAMRTNSRRPWLPRHTGGVATRGSVPAASPESPLPLASRNTRGPRADAASRTDYEIEHASVFRAWGAPALQCPSNTKPESCVSPCGTRHANAACASEREGRDVFR